MKSILSFLSKRGTASLGLFTLLCLFSTFSLRAQQASDINVVPTVTNGQCESDGKITSTVTSQNPLYTIQSCVYTYENETTHALVTSQNNTLPTVTGLRAGKYTLKVKVLFTNGVTVEKRVPGITVTTSYRRPVISIKEERPTLKGYPDPTGMIGVRVTSGSAQNYTVRLIDKPAGYTGYTEFTFASTVSWQFFYNLPAGKYKVQVSDDCISYPAEEVEVKTTATSFAPAIGDNDLIPIREHCGWYEVWEPRNSIFPYYKDLDTIAKYYDVTFAKKSDLDANAAGVTWYDLKTVAPAPDPAHVIARKPGAFRIMFRDPGGDSWFKLGRRSTNEKLWLAYRLKNTTQFQAYYLDYFIDQNWVSQIVEEPGGVCADYKRKVYLYSTYRNDFCPPVTVSVAEAGNPTVPLESVVLTTDNMESRTAVALNTSFSRSKSYLFTYRDGNGDVVKYEVQQLIPDPYISYGNTRDNNCEGLKSYTVYIQARQRTGAYYNNVVFDGYTVTLKQAPATYTPPSPNALQVGVPYVVPTGYGNKRFYPFSCETLNGHAFPNYCDQYWVLPSGEYIFEVTDPCGRTKELKMPINSVIPKYTPGPKTLQPKAVVKECGRMRIYPFAGGHTDILLKDGVSFDTPYVQIQEYPNGLSENDIEVFNGSTLSRGSYVVASSDVDPKKIYFDMPLAQGKLGLRVSWTSSSYYSNDNIICLPTVSIDLNDLNLSYERDTYVGYKCPSGSYAYINFEPTNYIGHLDVELRPANGGAAIKTLSDVDVVANGGSITIELTPGTPITEDRYLLYLKDRQCRNDNKAGTPISLYDLSSTSIVRTTRLKSKYCEGEPITLEAVSLGGNILYKWHLPDGSTLDGRVVEIAHSEATKHSGRYKLEAINVVCEGAPTSVEIPFDLSVAPPVLWWASDATNANWFDKSNWRNTNGVAVNAIPAACTTVHIPSEVDNFFPDLDPSVSVQGTYGAAECQDVYFHYGSQLGRPQLLRYERVYVDYNFGKMQSDGSLQAHAEPHFPKSDKRMMDRDRWYMLATPLKNILSGDFGLAGYPMTYQRYFKSGIRNAATLTDASFDKPVNTLVDNMDSFNHAIALKVAGRNASKVGYKDHKNLDGLKGIIRLPFYLNRDVDPYYPLHRYTAANNTSLFRYYDMATLAPMGKVDSYVRKPEEDFRFAFETTASKAIGAITLSGAPVEGYAFQLAGDTSTELRMVGNPFMSAIDFDKLVNVNSTLIEPYYYIFTNNTWKVYYSGVSSPASTLQKEILPLQAIVIKKKASGPLLFPTEGSNNVLLAPNKDWSLQSRTINMSDPMRKVSVVATNSAGKSGESILFPDTELVSAPALFYPTIDEVPTVYFVDADAGSPNVIQSGSSLAVVPMGVHSSLIGPIELDFSSLTSHHFTRIALYDRATRQEHDLLANPRYTYQNGANEGTRFELRMEYPGVKSVTSPHTDGEILRVIPVEVGYRVESLVGIESYTIYGVDGKQLTMGEGVNALEFVVDRAYCQAMTLLSVRLSDGSTLTRKLPAR